ncbi:hypothetical protein [Mesobacillus zeae]|uniref:Uncharacterized protein n=2 Tax=Mesobacillus zeae TaxID=1917180 RepID=A0A398BLL7_9BACI|nr:hypothetical protein [Mesobacillus zeae]RID88306.1 hypothetical protein D1970_02080 [Mesobacillus zeae]
MEDSYIAAKWENELEKEVKPLLKSQFPYYEDIWIHYDKRVGAELDVGADQDASYKDYETKPNIMFFIPRKKDKGDKGKFDRFVQSVIVKRQS